MRCSLSCSACGGSAARISAGFTALLGPSGSGKTTLLNLMMGIDRPDAGAITVAGVDITRLSDAQGTAWRAGWLSGGEQQRIAMVRALAHHPQVVFADESTANLDTHLKEAAHAFLADMSREIPVLVVSHDAMTRDYADQVVFMRDGAIRDEDRVAEESIT